VALLLGMLPEMWEEKAKDEQSHQIALAISNRCFQ
jgi:hypothetical protein